MANKLNQLHKDARPIARKQLECIQSLLAEYAPEVTAKISTWRDPATQAKLYAQGRTAPGKIVTHAQASQTAHCVVAKDGSPAAMGWDIILLAEGALLKDEDPLWYLIAVSATLVARDDVTCGAFFHNLRDMPHTEIRDWQKSCTGGKLNS